jgi:hypothetical protein
MILGFKTIHPITKTPTEFVDKILRGIKIHTVRFGNRWKVGDKIHFATGVRTKDYHQFMEGYVKGTQRVEIYPIDRSIYVDKNKVKLTDSDFTFNDGFETAEDFWEWFKDPIDAQLIHWTDFKYTF